MLSGHLQLSISLKNRDEIKQAIALLNGVLVEEDIAKIRNSISPGTFVVSDKTKIKPLKKMPETIKEKEAFLKKYDPEGCNKYYNMTFGTTTQAEKEKESVYKHNDVHVTKDGKISVTPKHTPNWNEIDAGIKKNKYIQKQKLHALRRKRDPKTGHFLKGKVFP